MFSWCSAGGKGFKGSRKSTPYAAQISNRSLTKAKDLYGLQSVGIRLKGPGSGRESALRAVNHCE